jgi:hypothetical protein
MIDTISPKERTMKRSFRWTVFFAMIVAGFLVAVSLAPGSFSQSAGVTETAERIRTTRAKTRTT